MRPFIWSFLWALVILGLCLIPGQRLPEWDWFALFDLDKLVHGIMFFVLAVLLAQALRTQGKVARYIVWACVLSVGYGLASDAALVQLLAREPAHWRELGVTEVLFGLPDRAEDEVAGYVERLAGKLAALV